MMLFTNRHTLFLCHAIIRNQVSKLLITSFSIKFCWPAQVLGVEIIQERAYRRADREGLKQVLISFQSNPLCLKEKVVCNVVPAANKLSLRKGGE